MTGESKSKPIKDKSKNGFLFRVIANMLSGLLIATFFSSAVH
jgi:hypothetical protein